MSASKVYLLDDEGVDSLARAVEEAIRASDKSVGRFVEPAKGVLGRATSKCHHIVFGRRGSGKSMLLKKVQNDLTLERVPVAFVDMEQFKGHSYPDVLISVLIASLKSFRDWIGDAGVKPASSTSFWLRLFGQRPTKPPLPRRRSEDLTRRLDALVAELENQLHAQDAAEFETREKTHARADKSSELEASLGSPHAHLRTTLGSTSERSGEVEVKEAGTRSKTDYLHRSILEYRRMFHDVASLAGSNAYLLLDDLYHIRRSDQAKVLDYFHRVAKDNNVWLKVGTIRHRTDWYHHGDPPLGLKLGDDAEEIDLDITLEKYDIAKRFLWSVLEGVAQETKAIDPRKIVADTTRDRLVLASGGVARDFLTIFRRSIEAARERHGGPRGPKIGAEDVNRAAGEHDASKREELKRDTLDERARLEDLFEHVRAFCFGAKTNCFLVNSDAKDAWVSDIDELVDLRLIHRINPRITISDRAGELFMAYMLDLSQYTGDRKRRGLEMIEFWNKGKAERLRRVKYIYQHGKGAAALTSGGAGVVTVAGRVPGVPTAGALQ